VIRGVGHQSPCLDPNIREGALHLGLFHLEILTHEPAGGRKSWGIPPWPDPASTPVRPPPAWDWEQDWDWPGLGLAGFGFDWIGIGRVGIHRVRNCFATTAGGGGSGVGVTPVEFPEGCAWRFYLDMGEIRRPPLRRPGIPISPSPCAMQPLSTAKYTLPGYLAAEPLAYFSPLERACEADQRLPFPPGGSELLQKCT